MYTRCQQMKFKWVKVMCQRVKFKRVSSLKRSTWNGTEMGKNKKISVNFSVKGHHLMDELKILPSILFSKDMRALHTDNVCVKLYDMF